MIRRRRLAEFDRVSGDGFAFGDPLAVFIPLLSCQISSLMSSRAGATAGAFAEVYSGGVGPAFSLRRAASWDIVEEAARKVGLSWYRLDNDEARAC
jgi:hypothetical protein